MGIFGKKKPRLERSEALSSRPVKLPVLTREDLPGGRAQVKVTLAAPRWVRLLGGKEETERTFGLDVLGREVYDMCDGRTNVSGIVRRFGAAHKISQPEAELSVTTFLKTLMSKGLVAMAARERKKDRKKDQKRREKSGAKRDR